MSIKSNAQDNQAREKRVAPPAPVPVGTGYPAVVYLTGSDTEHKRVINETEEKDAAAIGYTRTPPVPEHARTKKPVAPPASAAPVKAGVPSNPAAPKA